MHSLTELVHEHVREPLGGLIHDQHSGFRQRAPPCHSPSKGNSDPNMQHYIQSLRGTEIDEEAA